MATQSSAENNVMEGMDQVGENELTFNKGNRELLNIAVEIGEGKSANILIRERDDPYQVSYEFS
jgi:hypothetical protein